MQETKILNSLKESAAVMSKRSIGSCAVTMPLSKCYYKTTDSTHKVNHLPKDHVLQNQTGAKLYDQHETETHVAGQLHLNASAHEEAKRNQIIISTNIQKAYNDYNAII